MNALEEIWDINYVHLDINAIDNILKICDRIRKPKI